MLTIAIRNLLRHKRRTAFVVILIGLGLASYVFYSGFFRGMMRDMLDGSIRASSGHVRIQAVEYARFQSLGSLPSLPSWQEDLGREVAQLERGSTLPRLVIAGMAVSARNSQGVQIIGGDIHSESANGQWGDKVVEGSAENCEKHCAVIGIKLAKRLGIQLGRKLVLYHPLADSQESGASVWRVRAIMDFGQRNLDEQAVFVPLHELQSSVGLQDQLSETLVLLPENVESTVWRDSHPQYAADGWRIETWQEANPPLQQMQGQMGMSMLIYLVVIVIAVVAGVFDTLLIAVYERFFEFGVLRSIGYTRTQLAGMILVESIVSCVIGVGLGLAIGLVAVLITAQSGISLGAFSEGLRYMGMPAIIKPVLHGGDIVMGVAVVMVSVIAVALYPALQAVRRPPLELLRNRGL